MFWIFSATDRDVRGLSKGRGNYVPFSAVKCLNAFQLLCKDI